MKQTKKQITEFTYHIHYNKDTNFSAQLNVYYANHSPDFYNTDTLQQFITILSQLNIPIPKPI